MSYSVSESANEDEQGHLIDIIVSLAEGNKTAIAELYDLTSAKLFEICIRILGSTEAAEDTLQNIYIKIWKSAGQFNAAGGSPLAWMCVIARNTAIDARRKVTREAQVSTDLMSEIPDEAPLADMGIERRQDSVKIEDCLDELPSKQSEPIRSAFFGGFTYSDIAEKKKVPLSTIKSRVRRGLSALGKCLGDV